MNPRFQSEIQLLQEKITDFQNLKVEIQNKIAAIDALTISDVDVSTVIQDNRNNLQNRLINTENIITRLTTRKTHLENCCFTAEQQVKVDTINTTFSNAFAEKLLNLERDSNERKEEFFRLYDACDNTAVCEQFLLSWN